MSSRPVNCYEEERFDCIVGWDHQLGAFYAYVEDSEQEPEEELAVWLPDTLSLDDLAATIAPYSLLRPELRVALEQDRKENSAYQGFGPWDDNWSDQGAPQPAAGVCDV